MEIEGLFVTFDVEKGTLTLEKEADTGSGKPGAVGDIMHAFMKRIVDSEQAFNASSCVTKDGITKLTFSLE